MKAAVVGHFREEQGLVMPSIGLGPYIGEADSQPDASYKRAITRAAASSARGDCEDF